MRCYWDEEDVWFYFEVNAEGWVTRQIELQGPELTPIAAASLDEWQQARDAGSSTSTTTGSASQPKYPSQSGKGTTQNS